ncbi:MAG: tetratricopeptide repeat protein [Verrucomicrobia bacterium]|nr:tetratricopeptide repeat protein [Verrucomicrobiota bacterium]
MLNETIARYQKLLEQYPNNELARFSLGKAYFDAKEFPLAKEQFALALARKPDWMAVQILLGKCEQELNNVALAKAAFERARQLAIEQKHDGPLAEVEELLASLDQS